MALRKNKKTEEVVENTYSIIANSSDAEYENSVAALSQDEKHELSKALHKRDLQAFSKKENSLCFIVIGTICAIVGVLFIFLSFKKRMNKITGIDTASLQFFLMIGLFAIAAVLLTIGIIRLVQALKVRKSCKDRINSLTRENSPTM